MPEGMDMLKECPVQPLGDAVELQGVVCGEAPCCTCHCKVLIEFIAQVLTPMVGAQHLNASAVLLGNFPGLKGLVRLEDLVLGLEQVHDGVTGRIVCESDKVALPLYSGSGCWPPDIGVNLVPKVLGQDANVRLGNWDMSGACIDAHLAVQFGCVGIQFDTLDGPALNEFAGTSDGNVPKVAVQLHGCDKFSSMGRLWNVNDFVKAARAAWDFCDGVTMREGDMKASIPNMGLVPFLIQSPKRHKGVGDGRHIEGAKKSK